MVEPNRQAAETVIHARGVSCRFYQSHRAAGLTGAIRWLIRPTYRQVDAVLAVDLNVRAGERVALLGQNGAGKSTIIKLCCGVVHPSGGSVTVLGETPSDRRRSFLRQIGLISGNKPQLDWDLPARDIIALNQLLYADGVQPAKGKIDELARLLGADQLLDVPVRELSFGQRMRCELVAGLIHSPRLIFLDEPTVGLDVVGQADVVEFLKKYHCAHNITIIYASHNMDEISAVCERLVLLHRGRILFDGAMAEMCERYSKHSYLTFDVHPHDLERVNSIGYPVTNDGEAEVGSTYSQQSVTLRVPRNETEKAVATLLALCTVRNLSVRQLSLPEVIRDALARA